MSSVTTFPGEGTSTAELRAWVKERLGLDSSRVSELLRRVDDVVTRQRALVEESKHDAIRALSEGFAAKLETLQRQLSEKDMTVSTIARYFEELVADLTDKSHRDPKTKLLNFDWFMERLESYLAVEQRVRWCAVGVVDINSFKSYNDTLGHAVGDRIIEGVARILSDQIRSEDFLAVERNPDFLAGERERRSMEGRDLHARLGGDEFCFLIPDLPGCSQAVEIADRFKSAVREYDWSREDPGLAERPVQVDVGVVCLQLGAVQERRSVARTLAAELMQRADALMYDAKYRKSPYVHCGAVALSNGELIALAS